MVANLFVAALGAVFGSFANVLISRIPSNESWVLSRSKCPKCQTFLSGFELIPIVSYLVQRGRCRHCHQGISIRYPLIEVWFVFGAMVLVERFGLGSEFIFQSLIWAVLSILFVIDLETFLLPFGLNLILIALGMGQGIISGHWIDRVEAAILLGAGFFVFRWFVNRIYKREAFGGGDVVLAIGIGSILGVKLGLIAVYFGFMLGEYSDYLSFWQTEVG